MRRITDKDLQGLVNRLNKLTGMPESPYEPSKEGRCIPNAGNYHLDYAYGGVKLVRMSLSEGCTGITDPLSMGFETKRDCYNLIYAFIRGIESQLYDGE